MASFYKSTSKQDMKAAFPLQKVEPNAGEQPPCVEHVSMGNFASQPPAANCELNDRAAGPPIGGGFPGGILGPNLGPAEPAAQSSTAAVISCLVPPEYRSRVVRNHVHDQSPPAYGHLAPRLADQPAGLDRPVGGHVAQPQSPDPIAAAVVSPVAGGGIGDFRSIRRSTLR